MASGATIHAVKTLDNDAMGARSWQITAIDWITVNAVRPAVVTMSLGRSGNDAAYNMAIGAATEAGLTVVVAAGNNKKDSCEYSPASAVTAITVGAISKINKRASYSNWGSCNNIYAPGSMTISAGADSDTASVRKTGTSMACPHVAGAAALLLEQNPSFTRNQILERMTEMGRKEFIASLKEGDPDLLLWVSAEPAPAPVPTPAPRPTYPPEECEDWCRSYACGYPECRDCSFCW